MRIAVHAVGRMKAGPEKALADHYLDRFGKAGPGVGIEFSGIVEHAEGRAQTAAERCRDEAARLSQKIASGADLILLDERGKSLSSTEFAAHLGGLKDASRRDLAICIGGPDGFDPAYRERAGLLLSFGRATWPHQLVRIMLAEQLYRAATILAGHPYHRA
jgi:23S rRNA (pseudouridine1915-N3)-methyltransferase